MLTSSGTSSTAAGALPPPFPFPPTDEAGPDGRTWWERLRVQHALDEIRRRALRLQAFEQLPDAERQRAHAAEWKVCKGRHMFDTGAFLYWLQSYGWVRNEKDSTADDEEEGLIGFPPLVRNMPFMPWTEQEQAVEFFFRRLRKKKLALCPKSREVGITWLVLHIIVWLWMFWGCNILVGSRVEVLVDRRGDMKSLFERLRYILDRLPHWMASEDKLRRSAFLVYSSRYMNLQAIGEAGAQINGESTNAHFGRGGRYRLIFIDEFGAIEQAIAEAIISSTESAGPLWLVYNPVGETHPSYRLYTSLPREAIFELRWTADPYRPPDFLECQILPRGKLRRDQALREWDCNHREIGEGLIFDWNPDALFFDDTPEWVRVCQDARAHWIQMGGWDFGSGVSLTVMVVCLLQIHQDHSLTMWVDDARFWERTHWETVGAEALSVIQGYGGQYIHRGDPAGRNSDAAQSSWEAYLRSCGINIECLEKSFNDPEPQEWSIRTIQHMMATGRLRFNGSNPNVAPLIQSVQRWRRRVKKGQRLVEVNGRAAPLKDEPSHGCNALMYAVDGAVRLVAEIAAEAHSRPMPQLAGPGAEERVRGLLEAFYADRPFGGLVPYLRL